MALPPKNTAPPWFQAYLDQYDQQQGPYTQPATTRPTSTTTAPVSGGDMADIFSRSIDQQNKADLARENFKGNLFFGRHLGIGGGEMSAANPTGDPRDPWNNPAYFAGNPTNRAAAAINAQPLWSNDASGRLVHGSNYPGAAGPTTPNTPGPQSDTLPTMGPQEQASVLGRYSPQPDVFADRGLGLTPFGQPPPINPDVLRPRPFVQPPPPPSPPIQRS